jgi:hypothetical protein
VNFAPLRMGISHPLAAEVRLSACGPGNSDGIQPRKRVIDKPDPLVHRPIHRHETVAQSREQGAAGSMVIRRKGDDLKTNERLNPGIGLV